MSAKTGVSAIGTYSGFTDSPSKIAVLQGLVPNADAVAGTGAVGGGGQGANNTYLDEMSPGAATQIQVELDAMIAASQSAGGTYTMVAADDTANHTDIATGLADFTLSKTCCTIRRAGAVVTADAVFSKQTGAVFRIADGGATYVCTAGDVVEWHVRL